MELIHALGQSGIPAMIPMPNTGDAPIELSVRT
jgi:hypothetical protein